VADRRLQVFHAVAKHLSFTKAGEALHMTQPAVTFQIKQLEERFNTRLFERGGARVSLTPAAGEVVLDYAERILGLSNELDIRDRRDDRPDAAPARRCQHDDRRVHAAADLGEFNALSAGAGQPDVANSDASQVASPHMRSMSGFDRRATHPALPARFVAKMNCR
jgi:DNA-binding transcriptional ArsR family regulator